MTFTPRAIEAAAEAMREGIAQDNPLKAARDALTAALAVDGVALQGWQPIDSAPEETEILGFWQRRVHNGTDGLGVTIWRGGSWRSVDAPNQKYTAPTHWQPLPPPPAASDREERR